MTLYYINHRSDTSIDVDDDDDDDEEEDGGGCGDIFSHWYRWRLYASALANWVIIGSNRTFTIKNIQWQLSQNAKIFKMHP